ncbi:restriction endonuclease subunit S, partial [Crocinitomicaceae bacterium]|nr:restriction endonuclease subunit S [Crocinitomicaceae bacterium]
MKRYDSYKDSGVEWIGDIPSHWGIGKLNKAIDKKRKLTYGIVQAGEKLEKGIPYIRPVDMSADSIPSIANLPKTSPEIASAYVRSEINEGDIVFSIGPSYGKIGIAKEEHIGSNLTQGTARIAINKRNLNWYYFYLLSSPRIKEYWGSVATGATFPALNLNPLGNTSVIFPPISEQKQIVSFLHSKTALIDSLIEKTQRKIELLKEKRTALINEVVTKGLNPNVEMKDSGVEWIGEIPSHWGLSKLGFNTTKIGSGSTPKGGAEVYLDEGVPFIRSQNVHFKGLQLKGVSFIDEHIHDSMQGSTVVKNDVLLNITGGSIGRCCVVETEGEMNVNQHVSIIRTTENLKNFFLNYLISCDVGQSQVLYNLTGGNREGLTIEGIRNFQITLPPPREQQQIVAYLDEQTGLIDKTISIEEKRIELLEAYRQSLIS